MKLTDTDLDVAQEKRMDDCWNVAEEKLYQIRGQDSLNLLLKETPPKGYVWSGGGDWKNFKQVLDHIIFGQKHGHGSGKPLRR